MGSALFEYIKSITLVVNPRASWRWESDNLTYTTRQGSRVSCVAQTGFAAFVKGVQLISGSPYAETEQLSRLTSPSGTLATS